MITWLTTKSKLEKLQERYTNLMRKSFKVALKDKLESDRLNREANKLLEEIQSLCLEQSSN